MKSDRPPIIIYNPHSTRAERVEHDVFERLDTAGREYRVHATASPDFETNVDALRGSIKPGDTIISAAGDGTASQVANAVLREGLGSEVTLGFLAHGNFNDIARTHAKRRHTVIDVLDADPTEAHPLTIKVNGEYWRHAPAYMTLGWTALAASEFGSTASREKLRGAPASLKLGKSLLQLLRHYYRHRNDSLPAFTANGTWHEHATDILAVNSPRVGAIIRSPDYSSGPDFGVGAVDVSRILPNIPFGIKALAGHAPLDRAQALHVAFERAATLPLHTEGEFAELPDVQEVFAYKDPASVLKVLHPRD